jgi:hypothetical protein
LYAPVVSHFLITVWFAHNYSIFGGGSDLSDVENDDQHLDSHIDDDFEGDETGELSAAAEAEAVLAEDLGDEEDEEDGDYKQTEQGEANKLPSFKKDPNAPSKKREGATGEPVK